MKRARRYFSPQDKQFLRLCGMPHVRTSPYYPQSNGRVERWHRTDFLCCCRRAFAPTHAIRRGWR